jgi:hypothetical protein
MHQELEQCLPIHATFTGEQQAGSLEPPDAAVDLREAQS